MYSTSVGWINKLDGFPGLYGNGVFLEFGYSHIYLIARQLAVGATTGTQHKRAQPNQSNPYQQPTRAQDRLSHGKNTPMLLYAAECTFLTCPTKIEQMGIRPALHHKTAFMLVRDYDVIYPEDLRVANLVQNSHLAKSISDASYGESVKIAPTMLHSTNFCYNSP
jgi:hypothetical protein